MIRAAAFDDWLSAERERLRGLAVDTHDKLLRLQMDGANVAGDAARTARRLLELDQAHEAAHRLLFSRRRLNDAIGRWVLGYPTFQPFGTYRRSHFAHHRDEMGPDEPDLALYHGYPITKASWQWGWANPQEAG